MSSASARGPSGRRNAKKADSAGTSVPRAAQATASLVVPQPPQRLAALLHEHRLLLAKIKQKKGEHRRLAERIDSAVVTGQRDGLPLLEELAALDRQVHSLFRELLSRKAQPRKTAKIVREVYAMLQQLGQISPAWLTPDEDSAPDCEPPPPGAAQHPPDEDATPPWATGGVTAKRGGEQANAPSLRGLFHRLADALHPDKVQDESGKAERTEVMKELTQAYQAGDLARLIELERVWLLSVRGEPPVAASMAGDSLDQRCAELEATNRALRLQLDKVKAALRDLRRSPQAVFLSDMRRMVQGPRSKQDPTEVWLEALRQQRDGLAELLNFVRSYSDGGIDLVTFQRGPRVDASDLEDEEFGDLEDALVLDDLLAVLNTVSQPPKSRGRSRKRSASHREQGDLF